MDEYQITLLAPEGLQRCLIEKQLSCLDKINVYSNSINQLISHVCTRKPDLVIIDYQYLCMLEQKGQLPDFDLLDLHLLIHNVPTELDITNLMRLKSLKGILFDSASIEHLTESVTYISNGGLWLPRQCLEDMVAYYRSPSVYRSRGVEQLTGREKQILELISRRYSNQKIADQLFLAESTVKTHIFKLYKKLQVHRREDAVRVLEMMKK